MSGKIPHAVSLMLLSLAELELVKFFICANREGNWGIKLRLFDEFLQAKMNKLHNIPFELL